MKRHLQFPDPLKYTKVAPPPPSWNGTWSPKRERKAMRRGYESQARMHEHQAEAAFKRGQEAVARQFNEFAEKARAAAKALLGLGATLRKNYDRRRSA